MKITIEVDLKEIAALARDAQRPQTRTAEIKFPQSECEWETFRERVQNAINGVPFSSGHTAGGKE